MMMKSFIHFFNGYAVVLASIVAALTVFAASAILSGQVTLVLLSSLLSSSIMEDNINNYSQHIQLASGELQSGSAAVGPSLSPSSLYHPSLSPISNVKIIITSQQRIHGVAGQFIKMKGVISNSNSNESVRGGIAYISLVDLGDKIPVDLEDWSAEKGLYIPSIEPGQTLPLEWDVRLVKAGSYTIDILFNSDADFVSPPVTSSKIFLEVSPKHNLNPGNVLPVAFGVPAVLITILGIVNYTRGRKMGVYT
jgi:hypothetical protein